MFPTNKQCLIMFDDLCHGCLAVCLNFHYSHPFCRYVAFIARPGQACVSLFRLAVCHPLKYVACLGCVFLIYDPNASNVPCKARCFFPGTCSEFVFLAGRHQRIALLAGSPFFMSYCVYCYFWFVLSPFGHATWPFISSTVALDFRQLFVAFFLFFERITKKKNFFDQA